ncbi:hypothetical protein ACHAXM_001051 [Skeletonema potamos]
MKYHCAAVILATAASINPVRSDALATTKHARDALSNSPMYVYGYCIGCSVALTRTSDIESTAKTTTSSSIVEEVNTISSMYGGPDDLEHPNLMISKSMHNKEQPFLQYLLALSLFLIAVAVGFDWNSKNEGRRETCGADHKFDIISKRLFCGDSDDIRLTPTNDDDEKDIDEEEHVEEEEEEAVKNNVKEDLKDDTSVVPVVDNTAETHWSLRQQFHPTNDKEEAISEKEEVIIRTKLLNKAKSVQSIFTGPVSNDECVSIPKKITKRVSFHDIPHDDEVEVTSVSSLAKKRKGARLKLSLSLGNLCEMKSGGKK